MSENEGITVRVSGTIVHRVPGDAQVALTHPRWGTTFVAEEIIEGLTLITEDAIGGALAEPHWRYEISVTGAALNRRGRTTRRPEVGVFSAAELPAELTGLLVGAEALHARIAYQASSPMGSSQVVD